MFLALYTATVILSIGLMLALIVSLIVRGEPQVILCTECQQCLSVCPMAAKGCNPMQIMVAAKSNTLDEVMAAGGRLCVTCGKCRKACPRGLSPSDVVRRWRANNPAADAVPPPLPRTKNKPKPVRTAALSDPVCLPDGRAPTIKEIAK